MGILTIGVFSSLVGSTTLDFSVKLAEAAVAKGHKVNYWTSGNAVSLSKNGQRSFKDYSFLLKTVDELKDRPEAANLLGIFAALQDSTLDTVVPEFAGRQFSDLKQSLDFLNTALVGQEQNNVVIRLYHDIVMGNENLVTTNDGTD